MHKSQIQRIIVGTSGYWAWTRRCWRSFFILWGPGNVVYWSQWNKAQNNFQLNSDKAPANHNHDDRYYTESEINTKFGDISGSGTLIGELKWLPSGNIDNPNAYLNATGWRIVPYVTYVNIDGSESLKWSFVIGIYDHNNGAPKECQLAIGENGGVRRRYKSSTTWTGWTTI